jgi:peptide/nickel transport system ATP-binding protein
VSLLKSIPSGAARIARVPHPQPRRVINQEQIA